MSKIKHWQIRDLKLLNISFDENMTFEEARELLEKVQLNNSVNPKTELINEDVNWVDTVGEIVAEGPNRSIKCDRGMYYISFHEPNVNKIPTGSKVSCKVGHPGQHRGVAKDIKLILKPKK